MHRISVAALVLALAGPVSAADSFDPDARARAVAPFVDEQTVGLAHVDLTRIRADALVSWAAEVGQMHAEDLEETKRQLGAWLGGFTRAGGRDLYVVFSLADLPVQPPLVVVPLEGGVDADALRRVLSRTEAFSRYRFEPRGRAIIGGSADTLRRLRTLHPSPRPELAGAFAAAGDTAAQVLLLSTADNRRVIEELLPTLPAEVGGGSSKALTRGLGWAALGVDPPPNLHLRLVIQSPDPVAARALADLLAGARRALGRQKEVRASLPNFDQVAAALSPKVAGDRLVVSLEDKEATGILMPLVVGPLQAAQRSIVTNNLKQLILALHSYNDAYKRLPAVASFDGEGRPLLSWRVHLLPFLEETPLYKEFHLDEPWDSPHNRRLITRMPRVYQGPSRKLNREGKTIYLAPVGEMVAFTGRPRGRRLPGEFPDGLSNTIFLVEAADDHAVPWTKPEDLKYDPEQPRKGLGGHFRAGFVAALGDGSVRLIAKGISTKTLQNAFNVANGQPLGNDW